MGKSTLRRNEVSSIVLRLNDPGSRAVFLVEAQHAEERRKVRELFEALAQLGEVATLCEGPIMAYAVQLHERVSEGSLGPRAAAERGSDTVPGSFFAKIEAVLKDEFGFSLVERSFNEVVYSLVV